jgi:drug/metabolite transporter (DMT)-like permease
LLVALDLVPAGIAMLVFYLYPIFTGIIVALMGWAPFDRKAAGAAIVALLGLALTLGVRLDDYSLVGLAMAALAALGLGVVSAASGRVMAASDPLRVTVYISAGALVSLIAVAAALGGFQWPTTQEGWTAFILSQMFFAVAIIAYFVAIAQVGASTTATLGNLQPLVVIVAAFFILDQSLTPLQLLGSVIVVGALIAVARKGPRPTAGSAIALDRR